MDGPPGTGKSQTITNLIAQLLADGRTVLFVSEKAAALDVVANRLEHVGLDHFVLELHSAKASRREVVEQLSQALRARVGVRDVLSEAERARVRDHRRELTDYAQAVNEVRDPLGLTVGTVVGRIALTDGVAELPRPDGVDATLTARRLDVLLDAAHRLERAWAPAVDPDFVWRGYAGRPLRDGVRVDVLADLDRVTLTITHAEAAATALAAELALSGLDGFPAAAAAVTLVDHLTLQPATDASWWSIPEFAPLLERAARLRGQVETWRTTAAALARSYRGEWRDITLPTRARSAAVIKAVQAEFPGLGADETLVAVDLDRAIAAYRALASELDEIERDGIALSQAVGASAGHRTLRMLADLGDVVVRSAGPSRPDSAWFSLVTIARLKAAIEALRPLQDRLKAQFQELDEVFLPAVYDLDLELLRQRLVGVPFTARLSRPHRDARRLLGQATRRGKVDRRALGLLGEAAEARRIRMDLDREESTHGTVLGSYYAPRTTDFSAVDQALRLVEDVLAVVGIDANRQQTVAMFGAGGAPDPGLVDRGEHLRLAVESALARLTALGPFGVTDAPSLTVAELRERLGRASEAIEALASVAREASEHRIVPLTLRSLHQDATTREQLARVDQDFDERATDDRAAFGTLVDGPRTDLDALDRGLAWVDRLRALLGSPASPAIRERLHDIREVGATEAAAVRVALADHDAAVRATLARFAPTDEERVRTSLGGGFATAAAFVRRMADEVDDIEVWCEHLDARRALDDAGLGATVDAAIERAIPVEGLVPSIERAVLSAWLEDVLAQDLRLVRIAPGERESIVEEFRRLDRLLLEDARERVIAACNDRRPRTNLGGAAVIEREAHKRARHMPVRRLLEQSADTALALKPCFMMSPLSVSHFIPSDWRFDVVIFDEASQVPPADAVNCIYRGRQLVVAGDDRQLPPTSFFMLAAGDDEAYEEDVPDDFESILGLCKTSPLMTSLPLRWHYRSQHEHLILFSNQRFYEGSLITYPGAETEAADLGVEHFLVSDGIYRRGGRRDNPAEARLVADRVLHHARSHPGRSLGVVALSSSQAEAIEDAVDAMRREHPELDPFFREDRLDGFFVKNLETVQGDERDTIILSIGYGPDEHGKFTLNFGPLNMKNGWRRLNVAITRARRRVEVVSSFTADQISVGESPNRGVDALRTYLNFARIGPAALAIGLGGGLGDVESPFEAAVLATLRAWGLEVDTQVGTAEYRIDLAIRDPGRPGRYLLGVECDGAAYHSSRVARDRDRLRQEVLERLGWTLHRIWGPTWYRNRRQAELALRAAVDAALEGAPLRPSAPPAVPTAAEPAPPREVEVVDLSKTPDWGQPYEEHWPTVMAMGRAHDRESHDELYRAVVEVVEREAPVHRDLIGRRVAEAFGHSLTSRTQEAVDEVLRSLAAHPPFHFDGAFVRAGAVEVVRVPSSSDRTRRDAGHLPPEELQLAVQRIVEDVRSIAEDELRTTVARLFGFARTGEQVAETINSAIVALVASGRVTRRSDGLIRLVSPE